MTGPASRGGPLQGIRVLEITKVWAGPYAGKLLAFLGAEVIKVESLTNLDEMRAYGGVDINSAPYFLSINQEVGSVQVNMKSQDGMDLLRRMIAQCDVLIDNLRPGAMERLGLGYDQVKEIRPDIIQLSIKMYGNDGPLGYQTGYAPCFAAIGGLTALTGHDRSEPQGMNIRYGDSTVGASAAFAIVAALHHRATTGEGQFIDVSAVETMSAMVGDSLFAALNGGAPVYPVGNGHPACAPHGCYPCRDGQWLSIAAESDEQWQAMCQTLAIALPGFENLTARLGSREAIDLAVADATRQREAEPLAEQLRRAGVPAFRSQSALDLVGNEWLWASEAFRLVTDDSGNSRPVIGPGWRMSPDEARIERGAPNLGAQNDYVYRHLLGLDEAEYTDLKMRNVIS
ncbi:CaiB/BaiF CoA transferase family protein [Sphingomonas sp. 35-24ZXX]|uniref:CaiB/BaiF CoA transferase family protein n=1 Tax=Sphingomonas sp. 35-24ZXX TaxID=1545915 RepID=UPI00053BF6E4|nr:CaiB/BaiF CoA-transferase family protein [Sphingomonas sp. 35-24ZXX]